MSKQIKIISINNAKIIHRKIDLSFDFINSIDINQITGDFVVTNATTNSVNIFPQSKNSYIQNNFN